MCPLLVRRQLSVGHVVGSWRSERQQVLAEPLSMPLLARNIRFGLKARLAFQTRALYFGAETKTGTETCFSQLEALGGELLARERRKLSHEAKKD